MTESYMIPTIVLQCVTIAGFIITFLTYYHNTKKMHTAEVETRLEQEKTKSAERIMMQNSIDNISRELAEIRKMLSETITTTRALEMKIATMDSRLKNVEKEVFKDR